MGDLSKNFSRAEFACKCCGVATVDPNLVAALQELRDLVGEPIKVISGYRCPKHNATVGGAKRSQHMLGKAADIKVAGMDPSELARRAEEIPAFAGGGIGIYSWGVHVDVRRGMARWRR